MNKYISIIVPSYNSYNTIEKCLISIFKSNYKSFEIIVVDDNSNDDSYKIAERFRCKLIRLKERYGPAKARNVGAERAKGDILVFLDADCVVSRVWLNKIVNNFKRYDIGAVAGQYNKAINNNFIAKFAFYELLFRERKFKKFVETFPSCNFACKREIFEKIGGFSDDFRNASEDLEFSYRLGKVSKVLWDPSISVAHHFRGTIRAYIKQQFMSSRDDVYLFTKNPNLILVDTFEDKVNYFEITAMTILVLFIPLSIIKFTSFFILLLPILAILLLNISFVKFITNREGIKFSSRAILMIYLRNFIWLAGIIVGLFNFIFKKW